MNHSRMAMLGLALTLAAGPALAQRVVEFDVTPRTFSHSDFSTVEGRRAVQPLPFATYDSSSPNRMRSDTGAPSVSPGRPPEAGSAQRAQALYPDQWALLAAPPTREGARPSAGDPAAPEGGVDFLAGSSAGSSRSNFAGTTGVFTQYCENCDAANVNYPQIAIGALFFDIASGGSASCSASVIGSNTIVTAAHCCYDHDAEANNTNFTFVPAYRDGAAPVGSFAGIRARVLGAYRNNPGRANDLCVIRLAPDAGGNQVSFYTGWLGTAENFDYYQNMHAVGYPGNLGGGQFQQVCTATGSRPPQGCERNNVLNMGCSMTYGSSGGPWILYYRNGSYVNSVVSGYDNVSCTGDFGTVFNGPRFASNNLGTLCDSPGWC